MHKSEYTRWLFTYSMPAIWILEQGVKSVQNEQKHQNDLIGMNTLRNIDDVLMSLLLTLYRFRTFS